jgi:hypothetical protein
MFKIPKNLLVKLYDVKSNILNVLLSQLLNLMLNNQKNLEIKISMTNKERLS